MDEWQKPETITLWIVIIIVFFILLLLFIFILVRAIFQKIIRTKEIESKAKLEYQQGLLETTIKTQEKERKRIAADLHDVLIGKLTVLKMQQEISEANLKLINLIDESITTARRISHDLHPPLLEYTTLLDLIKELIHPWKEYITISFKYDIRNCNDDNNDFKVQVIRILQEMITNCIKHANASILSFDFRKTHQYTIIKVTDNGKGYLIDNKRKGLGLRNIETRVKYLKGHYRIKSKIKKGTSALFIFKND